MSDSKEGLPVTPSIGEPPSFHLEMPFGLSWSPERLYIKVIQAKLQNELATDN